MFQDLHRTHSPHSSPHSGPYCGDRIGLKLLVIAPIQADPNRQAVVRLLDQLGIPYDTLIATETLLTKEQLWQGSQANYQGIILTTGNLLCWNEIAEVWESALSPAQWQLLWTYEIRFGLRQLALYAIGGSPENYGVQLGEMVSTEAAPLSVSMTEQGRKLFPYLNQQNPITIQGVPVYPSQPSTARTVPLLLTDDGAVVAALNVTEDSRETLALTCAHTPDALHTLLLGYGLITWVTRGLFLGERRIYLSIHVDDIFNRNSLWDIETAETGEEIYRMSAKDAEAVVAWLDHVQTEVPNCGALTLDFAFNCAGIPGYTMDPGAAQQDPLTQALLQQQERFRWINHGYTHLLLNQASYEEGVTEITRNHIAAQQLGLTNYTPTNMVTAVVSGLENAQFLRAARDVGIRRLVSDTSKNGWSNPSPNTGIVNPLQPEILCIPRRPTNLFFDVSVPAEWESKYNTIYRNFWQRDLSVDEIIAQEGEMILRYLLQFDINPLMFHQANLRAYAGHATLLTDLFDYVLARYNQLYGAVPIVCPSMEEAGQAMERRALINAARVEATIIIGEGLSICTDRTVTVAITGVRYGEKCERYAGQWLSYITVEQTKQSIPFDRLTVEMPLSALTAVEKPPFYLRSTNPQPTEPCSLM